MTWLGFGRLSPDEVIERERARERLREQERRVQQLDRAVEVIQRKMAEEHGDAASNG